LLSKPPKFIVDENGRKVSVIVDIETFEQLMSELEDFYDNLLIDQSIGEETVPLEQFIAEEDQRRGL